MNARLSTVWLLCGALLWAATPGMAGAQESGGAEANPALLAACLDLVGDDLETLYPRYADVADALDASGADVGGMPVVAACFESLSLDELYVLHQAHPDVEARRALVEEYGQDWDEWVDLWVAHNPESRTAAILGDDDATDRTPIVLGAVVALLGVGGGVLVAQRASRENAALKERVAEAEAARDAPREFRLGR